MPFLIPAPTFTNGQLVHQADLAALCYDIDALAQMNLGRSAVDAPSTKPICKVVLSAPASIPTGAAATILPWDREVVDTDGLWLPQFPSRLTVTTPGWYRINAQAAWASGAAGNRGLHVLVNGESDPLNVVGSSNEVLPTTTACTLQVIAYEHLQAGATIAVGAYQGSGGPLSLQPSGLWGTHLTVAWDAPY